MKYIETFYIYCEPDGNIPELHNSDVIRLDNNNCHAYGIFICFLGQVFLKATRLNENGILDKPYSVSLVIPKIGKFNDKQGDTNLERIKFIANNFVPPKNGIKFSVYEAKENMKYITASDYFTIWPYKKQWDYNNTKNYVAINDINFIEKNKNYDFDRIKKTYESILNELTSFGIQYKLVGYDEPIEETFNILRQSKLFLSWSGGCYYLAGGLNVPTLAFGNCPLTQIDNYANLKPPGRPFVNKVLRTCWGEHFLHQERITHFDKKNGIHQRAQSHTLNIGNVEKIEEYNILKQKLVEYC
mgnify:CR=1 FL=1